jgi:hypothetical protein
MKKQRKSGIKYDKCLQNKNKLLQEYLKKKDKPNGNVNDKPDNKRD